jgi:hypothetical protein
MNTRLAKCNGSDEISDQRIAVGQAGHANVYAFSRSEEILSTLTRAFGRGGVIRRISLQPLPSATYFPELLSTLGGQALTAHWALSGWEKTGGDSRISFFVIEAIAA